jgi:hypothetical protein
MQARIITLITCSLALISCKPRATNSDAKDLLLVNSKMEATLYFTEGTGALERLIRARCGTVKAGFSVKDYSNRNYRNDCKKIEFDGPMPEFLNRWDRRYFEIVKRSRYTQDEKDVQDFILKEIRHRNRQGQPSSIAVDMDDPTFRASVTNHYRVLAELTLPTVDEPKDDKSGDPPVKEPTKTEPPRLIPTDSVNSDYHFRDTFSFNEGERGPQQLNWSLTSPTSSQFIKVSLRAAEGKSCFVSILSLATDRNEALATEITMPETFRRANGVNTPISAFSPVVINSAGHESHCEVTITSTEKKQLTQSASDERDRIMRKTFGGRPHRLAHYMWHAVRTAFVRPGTTAAHQQVYASYGWAPPRPIVYSGNRMDIDATSKSGAGEDFLYMHRRMVLQLKNALKGLTMYDSWKRIPTPTSTLFPLAVLNPEIRQQSPAGFQQISDWEKLYLPDRIGDIADLSSLGVALELTIHNALHSRWSVAMNRMRPAADDPITRTSTTFQGWIWDEDHYDHLSDSYSAHVNPLFWRIHGWVDDRIQEWLTARGYEIVSENCAAEIQSRCLQWRKDVWMGPAHVKELISIRQTSSGTNPAEEANAILSESGFHKVHSGFIADQPLTPTIRR